MISFRQLLMPVSLLTFCCVQLVLVFLLVPVSVGQPNDLPQTNSEYTSTKRLLSIENGLASHEVFCGVQDSSGFLWFGTRNGLNRYDGRSCLLFTRQRNKLQDNKVVQLAKDDANHLFVQYGSTGFQLATNGKVDVIDATTQKVQTLTKAFPKMPFKEKDVYWIANDGSSDVNFLTANPFRLWKYSSKQGFRLRYEMRDWMLDNPELDYRTTGPLCTFMKGQALLKLTNQSVQYFVTGDTVISFRQDQALRSLPFGLTEANQPLITYNVASNTDAFVVDQLQPNGKLKPVPDLAKYSLNAIKGKYWYQVAAAVSGEASTFYIPNDAIYLWNGKAFLKLVDKSDLKGFENLYMYRLFPDELGNLWLCTSLGVIQLTIKKNRFKPYFSLNQQSIEPNNQARGIYADKEKVVANIWKHTFDQVGKRWRFVAHDLINYALVKHGNFLYSGRNSLFMYDEITSKMIGFSDGAGSEIWSMFSLNDSLLLLGRTNGFSLFNSATHRFDSVPVATGTQEARFVYRFQKSKSGRVWAVAENGLYRLSSNSPWIMTGQQSPFLEGLSLLDAYEDENGIFWLATNGEGLYRWDPKTNLIRQFNITAGLPSDVLYRIEPDEFDNLWISSDYGLIRFNRKTFAVTTYTTIDGISHNEFNRTSSFRASDGRLFFGGLNGINEFDPRDFRADVNSFQVPLRVISFNQFIGSQNELIDKTTELLNSGSITLAPDDKFFTLDFQLLDYTKNEGHRYAYKIDGVDQNWNYINENSIRISGLPYGNFKVRVKAQNREGAWNKRELSIPLIVVKPIYLRWWFILAVIAVVVVVVYMLINFRLRKLAIDKKKLEEMVNERTLQLKKSLSEQSSLLLEKDVLMKEIHHRVKNNLQVISGLLELQSATLTDENARVALQEGRNRVRSIALIHQNLYQFENLSTIDLKRFVNDLCRQVQSVFQRENAVVVNVEVPEVNIDIDSAVPLGLILNELLTNSFKYAFEANRPGTINLEIISVEEGRYELRYSDSGPGLPVDLDLSKASTLGLQLVTDLSRQIGGKVHYSNANGAVFTINFTNREVRKNVD